MLTNIIDGPEYEHRKILAAAVLFKDYKNIVTHNSIGDFFKQFLFSDKIMLESLLLIMLIK